MARFVSAIAPRTASDCSWHLSGGSDGSVAVALGGKGIAVAEICCGDTGKIDSLINRFPFFRRQNLLAYCHAVSRKQAEKPRAQCHKKFPQPNQIPMRSSDGENPNSSRETAPRNAQTGNEFAG